jgi:hypothetical protein
MKANCSELIFNMWEPKPESNQIEDQDLQFKIKESEQKSFNASVEDFDALKIPSTLT